MWNNLLLLERLKLRLVLILLYLAAKNITMKFFSLALLALLASNVLAQKPEKPLRVGIAGLVHTHVHWILGEANAGHIEIVGVAEANRELAERYMKQYGLPMTLVYSTLDEMLEKAKPEAVTAFNTIFGHLEVVEKCAPKGIHVMVEKPLAVSLEHARKMKELAEKHQIHLLTNYETTWYPSTQFGLEKAASGELGALRKLVVHDGHQGPEEIGVNKEFIEWLTDPTYNGAGALTDFGCYGANLIAALMGNQRPTSVTAVTQTIKPDKYPKVDDEATIIVAYPEAQGIIQASWNWTFSRKDMELYGTAGYIKTADGSRLNIRMDERSPEQTLSLEGLTSPFNGPFSFFAAVVRGSTRVGDTVQGRLSSLENNMVVMEILDAAMRSAETGERITLK